MPSFHNTQLTECTTYVVILWKLRMEVLQVDIHEIASNFSSLSILNDLLFF